ncbi:site-specific DNA-methyltransferase [Euryarchaeota archaeon]|nr:site-specific DNA-methyltransferase [Euryarchaeota archaeon]
MSRNRIRVSHGDCIELMKSIESNSVEFVIADPPYNLGKKYGNGSDDKEFEEYLEFTKSWLKEVDRVLKDSGTICVFMGFRYISYLYQILEQELGYNFNNWIVWHYTQGIGKTRGFSPRHDDILVFTKGKKFTFNLNDIKIPQKYYRSRNNMRGANPGDVWKFSHVHYCNSNRQDHPTQKPEGLIQRLVLAYSNPNEMVLDPFSGSGTTLRVCQHSHRNAIGIELSKEYVEMTTTRLSEEFSGFDGIDDRMERVPNDLNDNTIREEYLTNHVRWFLNDNIPAIKRFIQNVKEKYGVDVILPEGVEI